MSRAPWVLPKPDKAFPTGDISAVSTTLGWRLVNPAMTHEWTVSLGEANEQLRERHGISRERQDAFALRSHRLADEAWSAGFFDDLTTPVPGTDVARDENIRAGTHAGAAGRAAAGVPPRRHDHRRQRLAAERRRVRGAAGLGRRRRPVIGARSGGPHRRPGGVALEPQFFGYAPVEAANSALKRAGIGWADVGAVELNEAFAVAVAGLRRCLGHRSGDRQHPRRRDRDRPPARRVRRPDPRHPGHGAAGDAASAGASPPSASGSARAWPWSWRT